MSQRINPAQKQLSDAFRARAAAYQREKDKAKDKLASLCAGFLSQLADAQKNFYDIYTGRDYLECIQKLQNSYSEILLQAMECDLDEKRETILSGIKEKLDYLFEQHPEGFEAMRDALAVLIWQCSDFYERLDEFEYFLQHNDEWKKGPSRVARLPVAVSQVQPMAAQEQDDSLLEEAKAVLKSHDDYYNTHRWWNKKRRIYDLLKLVKQYPQLNSISLAGIFNSAYKYVKSARSYDVWRLEEKLDLWEEKIRENNASYMMIFWYPSLFFVSSIINPFVNWLNKISGNKIFPPPSDADVALEVTTLLAKFIKTKSLTELSIDREFFQKMDEKCIEVLREAVIENMHLIKLDGIEDEVISACLKRNKCNKEIDKSLPQLVSFIQGKDQPQAVNKHLPYDLIYSIFHDHVISEEAREYFAARRVAENVTSVITERNEAGNKILASLQQEIDRLNHSFIYSTSDTLSLVFALARLKLLIKDATTAIATIRCETYGDVIKLWKAESAVNNQGDPVSTEELINNKLSVFGLFDSTAKTPVVIDALESQYGHVLVK